MAKGHRELPAEQPNTFADLRQRDIDAHRAWRLNAETPYGVDTYTRTFYFGPETPTRDSWEVSGEWVEIEGEIAIKFISVFPSRRVTQADGTVANRDPETIPEGGLNREIMRRFGTDAPIRRAIKRVLATEAEREARELTTDSQTDVVDRARAITSTNRATAFDLDWWVARADEYLAVAEAQGSKYGVQAELAETGSENWWGVGIAGTRYRVGQLRYRGLIDDTGPMPRHGRNHPAAGSAERPSG